MSRLEYLIKHVNDPNYRGHKPWSGERPPSKSEQIKRYFSAIGIEVKNVPLTA